MNTSDTFGSRLWWAAKRSCLILGGLLMGIWALPLGSDYGRTWWAYIGFGAMLVAGAAIASIGCVASSFSPDESVWAFAKRVLAPHAEHDDTQTTASTDGGGATSR